MKHDAEIVFKDVTHAGGTAENGNRMGHFLLRSHYKHHPHDWPSILYAPDWLDSGMCTFEFLIDPSRAAMLARNRKYPSMNDSLCNSPDWETRVIAQHGRNAEPESQP